MHSLKRMTTRLPSITIGFMALAAVFSLGIMGSMVQASAAPESYQGITGTGVGTVNVNNVNLDNVSIDFSASTGADGKKIIDGAFTMTSAAGEVVGAGTINAGHLGGNNFQLDGTLGANGILGVNGGKDFKIIGKVGVDVPVKFDSRLPGGGCRGSFTATVAPMDVEPT